MPAIRCAIAGAAILASAALAFADSSIRVLVNDKAITSYDIAQRTKLMQLTGEKGGSKAAMEALIDEAVELAESERRGFVAPASQVNAAYAAIAQQMKMSPEKLDKALSSSGVVPDTLKRRIKVQIAWGQMIQSKTRFEVSVNPSDVMAALSAEAPDKRTATEYILQQIIFVVPKGSSAAYAGQRKHEAEAFRGRYAGCETALEKAKALRDVVVRSLGRRVSTDLSGPDAKEIQATAVGKTTRPRTTDAGVELIAICSARKLNGDAAARTSIENKLMFEQGKDVGKDFLKELRQKAIIKYR